MTNRVWFVPVGDQPAAAVGPLLSKYQSGDAIQFIVSERTRAFPKRVVRALDRAKCHVRWLPPCELPHLERSGGAAIVERALVALGERFTRAVLVANGGTKEWMFLLSEGLEALGIDYELMLSQGAHVTTASLDHNGAWRLTASQVRGLSLDALCELLEVEWKPQSRMLLSRGEKPVELERLEAHHNYLWALHAAAGKGHKARDRRKGILSRSDLRDLGLETRRVAIKGFDDLDDGEPTALARRGFEMIATKDGQQAEDRFFARAAQGSISRRKGVTCPVRSGQTLTSNVGVLVLGTRGGALLQEIEGVLQAGASSVLFVADGAEAMLAGTAQVLGELMDNWKGHHPQSELLKVPWDVIWFRRHAASGMPIWLDATADIPTSEPDALSRALHQRIGPAPVQVFLHMKPGDKLLSWALWKATKMLPDGYDVHEVFETPRTPVDPILRMRLQAGGAGLEAEKRVRLQRGSALVVGEDDEKVVAALRDVLSTSSHMNGKQLIALLKKRNLARATRWFPDSCWVGAEETAVGILFERLLMLRLAQALAGLDDLYVWLRVEDKHDDVGKLNELDVVTLSASMDQEDFVAWEAKYQDWEKRTRAWRAVYAKADRFTPCSPDRTHAVVVVPHVPDLPSSEGRHWVGDGHLVWWGLHYVDHRVLFDDQRLRTLAQWGRGADR